MYTKVEVSKLYREQNKIFLCKSNLQTRYSRWPIYRYKFSKLLYTTRRNIYSDSFEHKNERNNWSNYCIPFKGKMFYSLLFRFSLYQWKNKVGKSNLECITHYYDIWTSCVTSYKINLIERLNYHVFLQTPVRFWWKEMNQIHLRILKRFYA